MAQSEEKSEKSLLETISNIGSLESELLEDAEVETKTEEEVTEEVAQEVVEETAEESTEEVAEDSVEEAAVFKVWGEDEEQDAEDSVSEEETEGESVVDEEEDDGIEGSEEPTEGPSDATEVDEDEDEDDEDVDVDDVDVSADDAESDMEDEIEDEEEVGGDDEDDAEDDEEEEVSETEHDTEDDGIDGAAEPDSDVDSAIDQISKTITAAATHKAMKKIEASYSMKEDIDALCANDDTLSEDFKTKAATIFEAAVTSKVREHVEELKEDWSEYVNDEVNTLHEGLVDKLDSYLTYVAEEWIAKNDVAVSNILRTEIAESFMASMKETFENHYIEMPEGKTDLFDDISEQNTSLVAEVESKDEEIKGLQERLVSLEKASIISSLSEGLADTQISKFKKLTEDVSWDTAETFTEKAKVIRESYFAKTKTEEVVVEENKNTETQIVVEETKDELEGLSPLMADYIKASTKLDKEAF